MHDVGSIVTTVNNNFDQGQSRTISREPSNEGRSSVEDGGTIAGIGQGSQMIVRNQQITTFNPVVSN